MLEHAAASDVQTLRPGEFVNKLSKIPDSGWSALGVAAYDRRLRKLTTFVSRVAKGYVEVLEAVLVAILIILTLIASGILIRDLTSLKLDSPLSELQMVVSDILVLVILIELTRSFVISSLGGERYLEGFIEMGVIILVREVAVAAMTANVQNALMASLGVALLVVALWVTREKISPPRRER